MTEKTNGAVRPNRDVYIKNRCSHSQEEMASYGEQWLAWSADASRIVAHHADLQQVAETVKAQGLLLEEVNFEWIPPGGEVESLL